MAARGAMGEKGGIHRCEAKENLYVLYPRRGFLNSRVTVDGIVHTKPGTLLVAAARRAVPIGEVKESTGEVKLEA